MRRRDGPSNVKVGTLEPVPYEEDGNQPFCYICRLSGELMRCDSCERSVHLHCLPRAPPDEGLDIIPIRRSAGPTFGRCAAGEQARDEKRD